MEQNAIQWLGAPCCLRGSFAFYKSFSCRVGEAEAAAVWKLGEFYFVRCAPQEPVCIAELTLLWEDRTQRHHLASLRLYFLPEDTPEGRRMGEHGEDEVLAVSKKIVVRVEDLVKWACPVPAGWRARGHSTTESTVQNRCLMPSGVPGTKGAASEVRQQVKVVSYPQYCRFRSLQRRIQDRAGSPAHLDPHLLALGGLRAAYRSTWILYCRDTFNHPTLDSDYNVWNMLGSSSLSLKGRPRKRRGREARALESQNCGQSVVSWMDKMKESVMGSVDLPWEGGWLPHPEEQHFLDQLYHFMESRGSPISKVPNLGFKKIDLFLLYSTVKKLGGYERVTAQRLWKQVYNELGGSPGSTSAATCTRRHYEKLMLAYEQHVTGGAGGKEMVVTQVPVARSRTSETQKGRVTELAQKRSVNGVTCQEVKTAAKGTEVRKRGRPPSRRHVQGVGKALASRSLTRQPSRDLSQNASPPGPKERILQPTCVSHLDRISSAQEPSLFSTPANVCQHTGPHQGIGAKSPTVAASILPFQPIKAEQGEPLNLCPTGTLGALCLPKGLHPLALFRARLGLSDAEHPKSECPSSMQPPVLLVQPKAGMCERTGAAVTDQRGGLLPTHDLAGGCSCRSKSVVPPLRVIPLDIGCSLQVCQLMRSHVGPTKFSSFTRKLSEVLAEDLSKAYGPGSLQQGPLEQPAPLNLSKRSSVKRLANDTEGKHAVDPSAESKRAKLDQVGSELDSELQSPSFGLIQEVQEQPADLSSPQRARAACQELAGQPGAARGGTGGSGALHTLPRGSGVRPPESTRRAPTALDHVKVEEHAGDPQAHPSDDKGDHMPEAVHGMLSLKMPSSLGRQLGSLQAQACWPLPSHGCVDTGATTPYH